MHSKGVAPKIFHYKDLHRPEREKPQALAGALFLSSSSILSGWIKLK
jgi:hypothetical protein